MKIETKYQIEQKIWIIYENDGEVCVYLDEIYEIAVNNNGIFYIPFKCSKDITEEEIILYEDKEKMYNKINEIMQEILKNEEEE